MKNTKTHLISSLVFILIVGGFFLFTIITPDGQISTAERRRLAQISTPTATTILNGSWFKDFDKYSTDQFPLRDQFRTINALARRNVFLQQDVNGLYTVGDVVFKSDYPISTTNIAKFVKKTNQVYSDYIKNSAKNYFVSVIPDKSYFDSSSHLNADASKISAAFSSELEGATYIDIFNALTLESYYKTDTHWSQDKLFPVMSTFAAAMDFAPPKESLWKKNILSPFYGVYHGQSALNPPADTLVYMTNSITQAATVENTDNPSFTGVYDPSLFKSEDAYNLFLSGGTPLTKITSPLSASQEELIIFRDSFGSSIAPLFLEHYRTVTLIDLRYFSSSLIKDYVDFKNKDVLVLYSSLILNSSIQLK